MELLAVLWCCGDKTWSESYKGSVDLRDQDLVENSKMSQIICTAVLFKAFADVLTSQRLRSEEKAILKGWRRHWQCQGSGATKIGVQNLPGGGALISTLEFFLVWA